MLQIACHAWSFNNLSLEDAIGTIARLGFRYIDLGTGPHLNVDSAAENPQAEASKILHLLDQFHLTLTDLYLMLPFINSADPEARETQLHLFEQLIPFATALGTPGITISPGIVQKDGFDHSLARSVPALMRMLQAAEDTDLRISFEPHMDSVAQKPEHALLLLEAVPGLSITLDYAHFVFQDLERREIQPLMEHVAHVQIRQAKKGSLQTAHDEGTLNIQELLHDLHEADYRGSVCIEYMTTFGWHGMKKLSISHETVRTRDAIRAARSRIEAAPTAR
ncbi:MAG TPA: sugar phosphate isomerase/epimerase family protein [Aggregatilineaceae bacterium]|nr:sugar phosphate isomerase/epimerase family protein [Aggregatilineaceae bacterium]